VLNISELTLIYASDFMLAELVFSGTQNTTLNYQANLQSNGRKIVAAVISSGLNTSVSVSSSAAGPHSHLCLAGNPIDHVRQTERAGFLPRAKVSEHRLTDLFLVRVIGVVWLGSALI